MEWQPIETAPDDTPILVYYERYREQLTAHRDGQDWAVSGLSERISIQRPTHWMPLPAPPTTP